MRSILLLGLNGALLTATTSTAEPVGDLLNNLGQPRKNYVGITEDERAGELRAAQRFESLRREQLTGDWFAALVARDADQRFAIHQRFRTSDEFNTFRQKTKALFEVWEIRDGGLPARRLTAADLAQQRLQENPAPTYLTATFLDPTSKRPRQYRLLFGMHAASDELERSRSYQSHRLLRNEIRRVLRARNSNGLLSAGAQWQALRKAANTGTLPLRYLPVRSPHEDDLFVAMECEVDAGNQLVRIVRAYRASEVAPRFLHGNHELVLKRSGRKDVVAVPLHAALEDGPTPSTAEGTSLRVRNPDSSNPRRWNVLEFGEAAVLRQASLAQLALINAHLENERKELAWQKSNYDRFANPVFTSLNIGGGLSGITAPLGEIARLAYNLILSPQLTPDVPTAEELEELFRFIAAKSLNPKLADKPGYQLTEREVKALQAEGAALSDQDVADAVRSLDESELQAMLKLPRAQNLDQKYRLFVDLLTDLGKATQVSEAGLLKAIFNNSRLSPNGDLSLTTSLALALGNPTITPLSGTSLQQLAEGTGPTEAWLQFLNVTIDLRSIANTLSLWRHHEKEDRELRKPFAHAPRAEDLAAYELRIFGYPMLFQYKRDLLKEDIAAYRNDFAYGILGTRVVEHYPTEKEFLKELHTGRMVPIGFVRLPNGPNGEERRSNLPVFGHRITSGPHRGKTSIIIYGLKAYRTHASLMQREVERFRKYERALREGGVFRRLVPPTPNLHEVLEPSRYEPIIWVGSNATSTHFSPLLQNLLEHQRLVRLAKWHGSLSREEQAQKDRFVRILHHRGVTITADNPDPLLSVDATFSSFRYRTRVKGRWEKIQVTNLPSMKSLARDRVRALIQADREAQRRAALGGSAR